MLSEQSCYKYKTFVSIGPRSSTPIAISPTHFKPVSVLVFEEGAIGGK